MPPSRVILVRHGETDWNRQGRFLGKSDPPLNVQGEEQARLAAESLKEEDIRSIYSSTLRRARQTAEYIARVHHRPLQVLEVLREMNFGIWEGLTFNEIKAAYPELLNRWLQDPFGVRIPGGETAAEVLSRVQSAWNIISRESESGATAVVGHGGTLRMLANHLTGVPQTEQWYYNPAHGQIMILVMLPSHQQGTVLPATLYRLEDDRASD